MNPVDVSIKPFICYGTIWQENVLVMRSVEIENATGHKLVVLETQRIITLN